MRANVVKPRVCIVIDSKRLGGPGKGIFQLIRALNSDECEFILVCFQYKNNESSELIEHAQHKGIRLGFLRQRFRFDPTPVRQLCTLIRQSGANVVQSHGYKSHLVAALAARKLNLPWIAVAHGWTSEDLKVKLYHSLDKILLRFPKVVITVSTELKNVISSFRPAKPIEVIHNAVSEDELPKGPGGIRKFCRIHESEFVIGCFGRMSHEKGQEILLEALRILNNQAITMHTIFVGDGPDKDALKELAFEFGLTGIVHFVDHQRYIRDCFEAVNLLVIPSISEGLPNVLLEAFCLGVPVLAAAVGAIPDVVKDMENGFLFPAGDAASLAHRLRELRAPYVLREVPKRAKLVLENFNPRQRAEKFLAIYNKVLT